MSNFTIPEKFRVPEGEQVVLTGIAGTFPESSNVKELQANLYDKKDLITVDNRRWELKRHPEVPKFHGKIPEINKFDAAFFGIHFRDCQNLDPALRIAMEKAYEAIVDAGVNPNELVGSRTAVFVGSSFTESQPELMQHFDCQSNTITGTMRGFIAHRISYYFKLQGPSINIDTACSSSLCALEHSFRAIRQNECDAALVVGVNLCLNPMVALQFSRLGVLSKCGNCRVFDRDSDGYVRSDAIGAIFVQRKNSARRHYAEIIQAVTNSDGYKPESITFPSSESQAVCLQSVFGKDGIDPDHLSYMEAHGTATVVGDPQEVDALDKVIMGSTRTRPLLIGSVKSNIGHAEPSSGICSVAKAIISMENGIIPPNINFQRNRKGVDALEKGRLKVIVEPTPFQDDNGLVGINNFGFGGSNCHILLRWNTKTKPKEQNCDGLPRLVFVSGRSYGGITAPLDDLKSQKLDNELISLYHKIYATNILGHFYRGYSILTTSQGELKREINCEPTLKEKRLVVVFTGFKNKSQEVEQSLSPIPQFAESMKNLKSVHCAKEEKCIKETTLLLSLAELLFKTIKISSYLCFGSDYLCDYVNGKITIDEAVTKSLKTTNSNHDSKKLHSYLHQNGNHKLVILELGHAGIESNGYNVEHLQINPDDALLSLLQVLGKLYLNGFNFDIDRLYPPVQYPVCRKTPMISHNIKWMHDTEWYISNFDDVARLKSGTFAVTVSAQELEWSHILGHVIDGRTLFPATGYLYIVWQSLAYQFCVAKENQNVVFEDCHFLRATNVQKDAKINLNVSIQSSTGIFEIMESDVVIVTGKIKIESAEEEDEDLEFKHENIPSVDGCQMTTKDVYKELRLRGYSYSGQFKSVIDCEAAGHKANITWEDNWITFMDNMLQMTILNQDTRLLYVPVSIKKLRINAPKHLKYAESLDEPIEMEVNHYSHLNLVSSGGIQIYGLLAKSIPRKRHMEDPVLEKYEFIPNKCRLSSLTEAMRVDMQILLENTPGIKIKVIEVIEEIASDLLAPEIYKALSDQPLLQPEVIVLTKIAQDIKLEDNIKVITKSLAEENECMAVVVTNGFNNLKLLDLAFSVLKQGGFVITRQTEKNLSPPSNVEIVNTLTVDNEDLVMLKRRDKDAPLTVIDITDTENFTWLPKVQQAISTNSDILILAENQDSSGILGFTNCLRRETGDNRVKCIFVNDKSAPKFDLNSEFYRNQLNKKLAINVYKNGAWGTYRHVLLGEIDEIETKHCYSNTKTVGDLSSITWFKGPLLPDEDKELIHIYYSALNFRDIMMASGKITADDVTNRLDQDIVMGFEFVGRTCNGDRVMGMALGGALATVMKPLPDLLYKIPDEWTMEQAATVALVYNTLIYALLMRTQIRAGQSILIHAGSGGIGQAAIHLATHYKLIIFTTVGTKEKRDFLLKTFPQIKESHIGNSRDTSFEQMIYNETHGRGVDFVVNSLAEEKLIASVRCLAQGGNFIEIGKFDLQQDHRLQLEILKKGASFHGIMLDQIMKSNANIQREFGGLLFKLIKEGAVKPLPTKIFEINQVEEAIRFMATGKHMGKVLIKIRDEENDPTAKPEAIVRKAVPRYTCRPDRTYAIVGGLGGFGLELADWLVLRGAKYLVLTSRKGISNGYQTYRIKIWRSYGVKVLISTSDVTTKEGSRKLIQDCNALKPVGALFNLAVVLCDAILENQTVSNFRNSFRPKAEATKYLDAMTRELCPYLTDFVIFSSVSCGRGNAGQTNYGMANSTMERICETRRKDGYPGLAIQWGAIGDVGIVADMQEEDIELEIGGTLQQRISSCIQVLDTFFHTDCAVVSSMVVAKKKGGPGMSGNILDIVQTILGIKNLKTISMQATLSELGMDSMTAVEIRQVLEREFQVYLSPQNVRTLTFAQLQEIQDKADGGDEVTDTKPIEELEAVALMIRHINDESTCQKIKVVMPTQSNSGRNAILLPGIEGMANGLEPLCQNLNKIQIVALQLINQKDSITSIATDFVPIVEETFPENEPFRIIAYSYGVLIALQIAAELELKGRTGTLICIDNSPDLSHKIFHIKAQSAIEGQQETFIILHMLSLILPIEMISSHKEKMLECATLTDRLNLCESIIPKDSPIPLQYLKNSVMNFLQRSKSVKNFQPNYKLKSKVILCKPTIKLLSGLEEDYGLSTVSENPVEVHEFSGNHVSILENKDLAKFIDTVLSN